MGEEVLARTRAAQERGEEPGGSLPEKNQGSPVWVPVRLLFLQGLTSICCLPEASSPKTHLPFGVYKLQRWSSCLEVAPEGEVGGGGGGE